MMQCLFTRLLKCRPLATALVQTFHRHCSHWNRSLAANDTNDTYDTNLVGDILLVLDFTVSPEYRKLQRDSWTETEGTPWSMIVCQQGIGAKPQKQQFLIQLHYITFTSSTTGAGKIVSYIVSNLKMLVFQMINHLWEVLQNDFGGQVEHSMLKLAIWPYQQGRTSAATDLCRNEVGFCICTCYPLLPCLCEDQTVSNPRHLTQLLSTPSP